MHLFNNNFNIICQEYELHFFLIKKLILIISYNVNIKIRILLLIIWFSQLILKPYMNILKSYRRRYYIIIYGI